MELVFVQIDSGEFLVGHFDTGRIGIGVDFGVYLETSFSDGCSDQADHDLHRGERLPSPVLADS